MDRAAVWHAGEDAAAAYLERLGWRILERNWRCRAGELDIIAVQPGVPEVVVFCEVKSRRGTAFGQPIEAITSAKLAKLRELAYYWLKEQPHRAPAIRLDAIGVLFDEHRHPEIDHRWGIA